MIDADALAKFIDYGHLHNPNEKAYSENDIREMIDMMPTADAVPVVRCKDCKHMGDVYLVSLPWLEQKEHRCRLWEHPTTPDDYCSRAERKDE